jgi:hypothetical protein
MQPVYAAMPVQLAGVDLNGLANQLINQTVQQIQKQQSPQNQPQSTLTSSANVTEWQPTGELHILSGNGDFNSMSNKTLTVSAGSTIRGEIKLQAINSGHSDAIAPLIWTPSWGDHSTSWKLINGWISTGQSEQQAQISFVAPTTPGTYHIVFAFQWEKNGSQVASASNWAQGSDKWNDGNDIAELTAAQISEAQVNGHTEDNWLTGSGYKQICLPCDAITLAVTANGSSTTTSTSSGSAKYVPNSFAKFLASQAGNPPPDFSALGAVDLANSIWVDAVGIATAVVNPSTIKNLSATEQLLWNYMVVPVVSTTDASLFQIMTGSEPSENQIIVAFGKIGGVEEAPEEGKQAMTGQSATPLNIDNSDQGTVVEAIITLAQEIQALHAGYQKGYAVGEGVAIIGYQQYVKTQSTTSVSITGNQGAGASVVINSITPIVPQQTQTIVISGSGFGSQNAFNGTSGFIQIHDYTTNWDAGFQGDWINLNVSQWTDKQIVIKGFTGAYGLSEWKLNAGDKLTISVWNAQGGSGPATYNVTVSSNK